MLLEMWWAYLPGYFFSVIISSFFIKLVVDTMWKKLQMRSERHPYSWMGNAVGYIERVLYTSSWLLGKSEFIAVWLALKVAGQWGGWTDDLTSADKKVKISGRASYNIFLIGNGLSISYAVVGAKIVEWLTLTDQRLTDSIIAPVTLIIGTLLLYIWIKNWKE